MPTTIPGAAVSIRQALPIAPLRHHTHRGSRGGGDSYGRSDLRVAHLQDDDQQALDFAVAASCLKHTVYGDFNLVTAPGRDPDEGRRPDGS